MELTDWRTDRALLVTTAQPYVHVEERIGSSDFVRCVADVFERDTLTVTAIDDEYVMRIYRPGTWAECIVFGWGGHPQCVFQSGTPLDPIVPFKELHAADC